MKKCREEGIFPGVHITEIEAILRAKELMEKVEFNNILTKITILRIIFVVLKIMIIKI